MEINITRDGGPRITALAFPQGKFGDDVIFTIY